MSKKKKGVRDKSYPEIILFLTFIVSQGMYLKSFLGEMHLNAILIFISVIVFYLKRKENK